MVISVFSSCETLLGNWIAWRRSQRQEPQSGDSALWMKMEFGMSFVSAISPLYIAAVQTNWTMNITWGDLRIHCLAFSEQSTPKNFMLMNRFFSNYKQDICDHVICLVWLMIRNCQLVGWSSVRKYRLRTKLPYRALLEAPKISQHLRLITIALLRSGNM